MSNTLTVNLSDIKDNPFRNFDRNPLIFERIESLITSIESTGFWDNVILRKTDSNYELAYGHHRLAAVRKAINPETNKPYTSITVPVRILSDAIMIKMMADENLNQWGHSPSAMNEAIEAARDIIELALRECETVEKFEAYINVSLNGNKHSFSVMRNSGEAGSPIIQKFLGKNWHLNNIVASLKTINAPREAKKLKLAEIEAEKERKIAEAIVLDKAKLAEAATKKQESIQKQKDIVTKAPIVEQTKTPIKDKQASLNKELIAAKTEAAKKAKEMEQAELRLKKAKETKAKIVTKKAKVDSIPSRETFEGFKSQTQASTFTNAIAKHNLNPNERIKAGAYMIKHNTPVHAISATLDTWIKHNTTAGKAKAKKDKENASFNKGVTLDQIVSKASISMQDTVALLESIEPYIDNIEHTGVKNKFEETLSKSLYTVVIRLHNRIRSGNTNTTIINPVKENLKCLN